MFFHCAWEIRTVDVNADGKVDLVLPDLSQNQAIPLTSRIALTYDEQSDTWETEQIGKLGPSQGSPLFLDVNGDGLPDVVKVDGTTGQPVAVLNTGDSHGGRFGVEVQSVTSYSKCSRVGSDSALRDRMVQHDWVGMATVLHMDELAA